VAASSSETTSRLEGSTTLADALAVMIPAEKQPAVARALKEAFGIDRFDDILRLTAGLSSALVFRIVVRGRPYLLRVITRTDEMADPTTQFACMRTAAQRGIAPHVLYTSVEDRLSITDFIEARAFSAEDARADLPATLRTLHSLPPFPPPKGGNYFDMVDGFMARLTRSLPEREARELSAVYSQVGPVYPRHDGSSRVSCHNDLKAENILFDGRRVWLVDWEAAFWNDRYVDLGVVANFAVNGEAEEKEFLRSYFEEPAGEYRQARLFLARQVLHVFYATVFLSLAAAAGQAIDTRADAPTFADFHRQMLAGEISLADAGAKLRYGLVHWKQLQENIRTARFQEASKIVSTVRLPS
jgi:aminoglycoside phosphotransferase (APT) family kinase protein